MPSDGALEGLGDMGDGRGPAYLSVTDHRVKQAALQTNGRAKRRAFGA
jgi:hypothetical protein